MTFGKMGARPLVKSWTARDYVQDGLVAMWDGIENAGWGTHNASATTWKDLVGIYDFDLQAHASVNTDSMSGDGLGMIAKCETTPSAPMTIECVFRLDGYDNNPNRQAVAVYVASNTRMVYCTRYASGYQSRVATGTFGTASYSTKCANPGFEFVGKKVSWSCTYGDNTPLSWRLNDITSTTFEGAQDGIAGGNYLTIGGSVSDSSSRYFKGSIYCVRFYSRNLIADEIAHNYAIDKERFNLP